MPQKSGRTRRLSSFPFLVSLNDFRFNSHWPMNQGLMIQLRNPLGAFTPTCSVNHMPGYIKNLPQLRAKGVDIVAVVAFNDPFVMSAWGKANEVRGDEIVSIIRPV
jgi:alkyl hydroperoxide reductase 1